MPGTIIFLNGTSSSGKTTLAMTLQEKLDAPYQHMALDQFRDGLPAKFRGLNSPSGTTGQRGLNVVPVRRADGQAHTEIRFGDDGIRLLKAMRRAIAVMADEGVNVIIDDIILSDDFLKDYLEVMTGIPVYFVGVRCPLETIARREAARPGRFPGTAEGHIDICHAHDKYDVEIDTGMTSPAECADQVIKRINDGAPDAFLRLRAERVSHRTDCAEST